MAGLRFKFAELIAELDILKTIGEKFLDPGTIWVLDKLRSNLNSVWSAEENQPIKLSLSALHTKQSPGDYEIGDRHGKPTVYAVITGTWVVRPLGNNAKKSKAKAKRLLEFSDIASTVVELYDVRNTQTRVAMWRMELGADDHPGCYFHVHVLGDSDEPPFPKGIPIPRLPSVFVTPMGAIEYVLSELFQDKWAKAAATNSHQMLRWRSLQIERLHRLLNWYQKQLDNVVSSPWVHMKSAKPDGEIFL